GPKPTDFTLTKNVCNYCHKDKKYYCFCGAIIDWDWDKVEYENYKWCKWCQKTTHNTKDCWFAPSCELKLPEITSPEWKKKIKCSKCSVRCNAVYHDVGEQCPKTYRRWNDDWGKTTYKLIYK
ncbi:8305_t:CDS:1, partial [Gigaspora rosea]